VQQCPIEFESMSEPNPEFLQRTMLRARSGVILIAKHEVSARWMCKKPRKLADGVLVE
jgi:hypothetical protein